MAKEFDWKEFIKIAGGVILIGVGVLLVGEAGGDFKQMILGIVLTGIGVGLLLSK